MSPQTGIYGARKGFQGGKFHWVENTPEELEAVTKEMIERTVRGLSSSIPDDNLQKQFKTLVETCGLKYGGRPVKAFASISQDFIEQHRDLL